MVDEQAGNTDPNLVASPTRRGSFLPSLPVWIVAALGLAANILVRRNTEDLALINLVFVISLLMMGFALLVWFRYFSAYELSSRKLVGRITVAGGMLSVIGAAVYGYVTDKKLRFSGAMVPSLVAKSNLEGKVGSGVAELTSTTPSDFPQFLGPNRNSVVGANLADDWSNVAPKLLWKHEIGAGWSAFAAVNGFAVTMEQRGQDEELEVTTCYKIETGEPVWSSQINARHTSVLGFLGPRSTPTIHEGKVYVVGATGVVRCLDGSDGSEIWSRNLLEELGVSQAEAESPVAWGRAGSPLIVDDMVVVTVGGADSKIITLMALDLESGETRWESGRYQISYASPTLATLGGVRQIISVNENFISSHRVENGAQLWEHPWEGISNMNANCSQPHALDDSTVFISKGYGRGSEVFEVEPSESDDEMWKTNTVWAEKVLKTKFSNVALQDGYAYGLDDGILSCVDLESGKRMWKKGRYGYGQVLLAGDKLLVMSERKGTLSLVSANPDKYVELGKIDAIEGMTWNNLCLYGNRLMVRNSEQAACFELPER